MADLISSRFQRLEVTFLPFHAMYTLLSLSTTLITPAPLPTVETASVTAKSTEPVKSNLDLLLVGERSPLIDHVSQFSSAYRDIEERKLENDLIQTVAQSPISRELAGIDPALVLKVCRFFLEFPPLVEKQARLRQVQNDFRVEKEITEMERRLLALEKLGEICDVVWHYFTSISRSCVLQELLQEQIVRSFPRRITLGTSLSAFVTWSH